MIKEGYLISAHAVLLTRGPSEMRLAIVEELEGFEPAPGEQVVASQEVKFFHPTGGASAVGDPSKTDGGPVDHGQRTNRSKRSRAKKQQAD
jgi:hypothetical protein